MARSLRSLSGSGLTAAPTPRSILAPPMKAQRCHHPSRQRQPSFACDPVSNHAQLAVSGAILIAGPPVNLNGSLVVRASELRAAAALLAESCAARGARPLSSL